MGVVHWPFKFKFYKIFLLAMKNCSKRVHLFSVMENISSGFLLLVSHISFPFFFAGWRFTQVLWDFYHNNLYHKNYCFACFSNFLNGKFYLKIGCFRFQVTKGVNERKTIKIKQPQVALAGISPAAINCWCSSGRLSRRCYSNKFNCLLKVKEEELIQSYSSCSWSPYCHW